MIFLNMTDTKINKVDLLFQFKHLSGIEGAAIYTFMNGLPENWLECLREVTDYHMCWHDGDVYAWEPPTTLIYDIRKCDMELIGDKKGYRFIDDDKSP